MLRGLITSFFYLISIGAIALGFIGFSFDLIKLIWTGSIDFLGLHVMICGAILLAIVYLFDLFDI